MQPSFITTIYADQLYCHDLIMWYIYTLLCQNELKIDESLSYSELNRKVTLMLVCFKHKPKNSSYG